MTPERWQHIDHLLQQVMNQPPGMRAAFLDDVCTDDPATRDEIESLISFREMAKSFLETPAIEAAPEFFFEERQSLVGESFGSYTIEAQLGTGGMGEVYLAHDTKLDRKVAIKFLPVEMEAGERARRLIREAKAAARLDHPNICAIHEVAEVAGHSFIVMQYVEGETLASRIQRQPLELNEALGIITQVADALSEAHSQGIIHRDIKPQNIMISARGQAKVLDFGLAKMIGLAEVALSNAHPQSMLSAPGVIAGTAPYMSPEQATGAQIDTRSDLFSLGVVLYECVTGKLPFTGASALDICEKVAHVTPPPPSQLNPHVPPELEKLILKALAKDPDARYQSAGELLEDLLHVFLPPETTAETTAKTAPPTSRYKKGLRSLFLVAGPLAVLSLLLYFAIPRRPIGPLYVPKPEAQFQYQQGLDALAGGAYYTASKKIEQAVQEDSEFALAHARLAEAYSELDSGDKAAREVLAARRYDSNLQASERLRLDAITKTVSRDFVGAVQVYQQILDNAAESDKSDAHFSLGRAYEKLAEVDYRERNVNYDKALYHYEQAIEDAPSHAAAMLRAGIRYGQKKDSERALSKFGSAEKVYQDNGNKEGYTEAIYQRALHYKDRGEPGNAEMHLARAIKNAEETGNRYQQIKARLALSRVLNSKQKLNAAKDQATRARDLAQEHGAQDLPTEALLEIGEVLRESGEYEEAKAQLERGLEFARRDKGYRNEGRALMLIATLYMNQHDIGQARNYIDLALVSAQELGMEEREWFLKYLRADMIDLEGNYIEAENSHRTLLQEAEERGWDLRVADSHQALGNVSAHRGLFPEALERFNASYEKYKSRKVTAGVIDNLTNMADMLWRLGRFTEAREKLDQAFQELGRPGNENKIRKAKINRIFFQITMSEGRLPDAVEKGRLALITETETSSKVEIESALGLALCRVGRTREGIKLCREAVNLSEQAQPAPWLRYPAKLALAEALFLGNDRAAALEHAREAREEFLRKNQREPEWRALVIAARAGRFLQSSSSAAEYAAAAQLSLSYLRAEWGEENYLSYTDRPDIKAAKRHLDNLLRFYQ